MASSRAARTAGSMPASAASIASCGTAKSSRSTPSRRAVISRTAWAPRMRTSSHSGRTVASTESMSVAARGSRPESSRTPGSADPRRSMRASTADLRAVPRRGTGTPQGSPGVAATPGVVPGPGTLPLPRRLVGHERARGLVHGHGGATRAADERRRGGCVADVIPLFPLATPLFPGVVLPLQVFEPRYRRLVQDLLARADAGSRFFGVVAIRQGWEGEQVAPAEALYD